MNDLLGIGDIGGFVGLNPQTGYNYSSKGKLPEPDVTQGKRSFWFPETIIVWARQQKVGKYKYL